MVGKYMIYKFYNEKEDDFKEVFFLPDNKDPKRVMKRLGRIHEYKSKGYQVVGILYVDYETYLNYKLHTVICEYNINVDALSDLKKSYDKGLLSQDVYLDSKIVCKEFQWTCLKRVDMLVNRIKNEGLVVHSLTALELQQKYLDMLSKL